MRKPPSSCRWLSATTIVVVLLDQLTKYWCNTYLVKGIPENLIPNLIQLNLVENTGAAFSLFPNSTFLLALLSFSVSLGLLVWLIRSTRMSLLQGISIAILLGGSLGNGLDRWRLGYVVDFLEIIPINFPIFNVADIAINIAVFLFVIENLIKKTKKRIT